MYPQSNEISFNGKNIYVGIDVHLKSWTVTVMSDNLLLKTFTMDSSADALWKFLSRNYPGASFHSVYEAGFSGYSAHRRLRQLGVDNIVVNPADVPTTGKEKLRKTDAVDSAKLARSLRAGDLKPVYVPEEREQELRAMTRLLSTITKDQTREKNRIKNHLHFLGIEIPSRFSGSACWSHAFIDWLKSVSTATPYGKYVLDEHIRQLEETRAGRLGVLRALKAVTKEDSAMAENIVLLQSIPGIGEMAALKLLSEIVDIRRFKDSDHLAAFVGMIPMCHKSGDDSKEDNGGITTRANRALRGVLIEASWVAASKDPALSLTFENYCRRMRKTDAIVKIARKLVNRIYYVLKRKTPYVPSTT